MTVFGVVGDLSLDIVVAQSGPRREGSDVPAKITLNLRPGCSSWPVMASGLGSFL